MHDRATIEKRTLKLIDGALQLAEGSKPDEERLEMFKEAVDALPIGTGVTISDVNGKIIYANAVESLMHGYAAGELVGLDARILAPGCREHRLPPLNLSQIGLWKRECLNVRKDGVQFPVQLSSTPLRNSQGKCTWIVTVCEDISRRKDVERQLEQLAYYDTVTELPNRVLLMDRLHQALAFAAGEGRMLALLFLDLDNFKDLNETRGHEVGDRFLKEVARRLGDFVGESDTLARLGGDEFVIVLSSAKDEEGAAAAARRVQALFSEPFLIGGEELYGSTSIGVALYPEDGADVQSLLKSADAAMYHAKHEGKSNYQFFSQGMNDRTMRRVALESGMRQGMARGEFSLHYQPQWDLKSDGLTGVEALLRWQSEEFGCVSPEEFIPIAEQSGLIFELGEMVLRAACLQARNWAGEHGNLKVAVNISGRQLKQPDFLQTVARIIAETHADPCSLELEFTESVIMERAERNIGALMALKQMGLRLSVDDFGTGYSSLNYLKHFPIDSIKIDRSFIDEVDSNSDDAAITEAIICMAHSLKLKVIAEGVENEAQLRFLRERNCDEAQGFYLSFPMPAPELTGYLEGRQRKIDRFAAATAG
jgi:diguanylate cyclase (GGDEF)-like protein/PAS domain S-box-containing protein